MPKDSLPSCLGPALQLAELGLFVFPTSGKTPFRDSRGFKDATPDPDAIRDLWRRFPGTSVGIATGLSGLVVIDIDPRHGGDKTLAALELEHGKMDTVSATTGGGGTHYYYRSPVPAVIPSGTKVLGPGVDVRGEGGYVIAPPSIHESGETYRWNGGGSPFQRDPEALPDWLLKRLKAVHPVAPRPTNGDHIPAGERNDTLTRWAGAMRRQGADPLTIETALQDANARRCDPPLPVDEVKGIAASVGRYSPGHDPHADTLGLTDMGNATRFVQRFRNTLRFCWEWSRWLWWTGYRWETIHPGKAIELARDVVRDLYGLAQSAISPDDRKRFAKHAMDCESQRRLESMVSLARSEAPIPVKPDDLDAHPWLLCTPTVTVDLKTGDAHPPRPDELHTMATGVQYDPDAQCPRWMDFLDETFGADEALKDYVHRIAGYGLVGLQREQVFFLFHGRGANGKSTLLRTLAAVIGDYARSISPTTLLAKTRDATAQSEMASLRGARFVHASEFPRGKSIDAELLKRLTGGDPVNARLLYAESFTFTPVATFVFSANDRPRVTDASHAFWRRAKLIPFSNVIPEDEQDPDLVAKLLDESPGILAWCVRGCLEWQKRPLSVDVPASVRDATQAYRTAEDRLAEFVEDHCTIEDGAFTATADLYREYAKWAESEGEKPQSKTGVVRALQTAFPGVDSDKQRGQRGLSGIRMNEWEA